MIAALLALFLLPAPARAADAFEACDAALSAASSRYEGWRCYYMAARRGASWETATERLAAGVATGDPWAEVVLAHVRSDQADPRAEATYLHAIEVFASMHAPDGEAQSRFGLANFRWNKGASPAEVQALLDEALANAREASSPILVATAQAQLARHLWRTGGDYDRAWTLARGAEAAAFPDGPYQLRLLVLHVLGGLAGLTARPEEELDLRRRMVLLAVSEGDAYVEATSRLNLAQRYLAEPDDAPAGAAETEARSALAAAERAGNGYSVAGAHCTLGRALGPGNPAAAAEWQRCVEGYGAVGAPEAALYGMSGLATAMFRSDWLGAIAKADAAVAQAGLGGQEDAALNARLVAAALRWQSASRDAEAVTEAAIAETELTRDRQMSEEGRASVGAMGRYAYDLLATGFLERDDVAGAFGVLERLRARELRDRLAEIGGTAGILGKAFGQEPGPTSLSTLQAALGPSEVFVSFELPPGQTLAPDSPARRWAVVVTSGSATVVDLPATAGLSASLDAWTGLLARRDGSGPTLKPVDPWIRQVVQAIPAGFTRVVVVPDGPLHRAPLAGAFGRGVSGSRAVSVVPSAAVWLRLRAASVSPSGAVLGIADAGLPRAEAEVRSSVFRLGGRALEPREATPAALRAMNPASWRVLHFATHAVADIAHPDRSEVRFSSFGGALRPRDLATLGLNGQVVILSACSGTAGRVVDGEGVLGLARSFLAGGARVVVGSRWPMRDTESEALVSRLTTGLGEGLAVDVALARAQDSLAAEGAPYAAWAGFMVVGDGSAVPFPGGVWRFPRWAGVLLLATGVAIGAAVRPTRL
ncbi:hypothetical protein LBMAG42_09920 [Deltaproteobacteria bacterium]|nr:hypothetical protein LBMAG42_09920 [Deltaproteobacteria bacterium]